MVGREEKGVEGRGREKVCVCVFERGRILFKQRSSYLLIHVHVYYMQALREKERERERERGKRMER